MLHNEFFYVKDLKTELVKIVANAIYCAPPETALTARSSMLRTPLRNSTFCLRKSSDCLAGLVCLLFGRVTSKAATRTLSHVSGTKAAQGHRNQIEWLYDVRRDTCLSELPIGKTSAPKTSFRSKPYNVASFSKTSSLPFTPMTRPKSSFLTCNGRIHKGKSK